MQSESFHHYQIYSSQPDLSEDIISDDSSYEQKVSIQPIGNQMKQLQPSNEANLNDLSTTNFHYEVEESLLSEPPVSKKDQQYSFQPQFNKSPPHQPSNLKDDIDDEMDMKDILKLLECLQQDDQPQTYKKYCPHQRSNHPPVQQVLAQKHTKKANQPKNKDPFKKPNHQMPPLYRQQNIQSFDFQSQKPLQPMNSALQPMNSALQPMKFYPPTWTPWQQYQISQPNQRPYFQKPTKFQNFQKPSNKEEFASQNIVFWNVLISIKLCSFLSLRKNVLLVPFSSSMLEDRISRVIAKRLKYNIRQILSVQAQKSNQKEVQDGHVFSVKAKGFEKNYRGIYFVKSPSFSPNEGMKYYSLGVLKASVKRVFDLVDDHMEQEIVFPDLQWGCLNQNEICESLIGSIFREVSDHRKNYKCMNLKQVIISVNSCQSFQLYSMWLKSYVQQLRG